MKRRYPSPALTSRVTLRELAALIGTSVPQTRRWLDRYGKVAGADPTTDQYGRTTYDTRCVSMLWTLLGYTHDPIESKQGDWLARYIEERKTRP